MNVLNTTDESFAKRNFPMDTKVEKLNVCHLIVFWKKLSSKTK